MREGLLLFLQKKKHLVKIDLDIVLALASSKGLNEPIFVFEVSVLPKKVKDLLLNPKNTTT